MPTCEVVWGSHGCSEPEGHRPLVAEGGYVAHRCTYPELCCEIRAVDESQQRYQIRYFWGEGHSYALVAGWGPWVTLHAGPWIYSEPLSETVDV